ncbi:MAG: diphosphomevalonate decarboxylase [Candidatus Aenigmarchaeota archaeon]|nr:diphosphomevalonate decarboxylase [Candidatus Aenigmarchaeota archaeon]
MKSTAVANANIALVKYWGKRDKELMLPQNSSISMTCDGMSTATTVEFGNYKKDIFVLDGREFKQGTEYNEVTGFLDIVRKKAEIKQKAKIVSQNNMPTAAGLASSASGFAALALASSKAAGLDLNEKELSMLARRGSGSASRSIGEGFVEWYRGEKPDGLDSYAESIAFKEHWPEFRMLAVVVSKKEKKIKSRAGMAQTVANCSLYPCWLNTIEDDLKIIRNGIKKKNFTQVGERSQLNCLKMHATMMSTTPPIIYWNPTTIEIMHSVIEWNENELESYFTVDAGPQVKIICLKKNVPEIEKRLKKISNIERVIECRPGDGAKLIHNHLF